MRGYNNNSLLLHAKRIVIDSLLHRSDKKKTKTNV